MPHLVPMASSSRDTVRMHACAFNGRDLDNIALQAEADAPCFCDGEWVGEGPQAVREALEREFTQDANLVARMARLDNEPVLMEIAGNEGRWETRGALRFKDDGAGRIRELRIDHGPRIIGNLVPEPDI